MKDEQQAFPDGLLNQDGMTLRDHLAAIEAASTIEELKNVYTVAYGACGSDKTWQKKVIDAKEKRKGELK